MDYFPVDVDMDQDDKIALIEAKYKIIGFALIIKLLMKIYKEGYFYKWTEREQLLFANKINVDINTLNEIVNDCVKWDFFNKDIYEKYQVLTSSGIQKRYIEAAKRRKELTLICEYVLVDIEQFQTKNNLKIILVNAYINPDIEIKIPINDDINPQSKVKESKVKESKEEYPPETTSTKKEILNILKNTPNYPFDYKTDLEHIRGLMVDYPDINLLAEIKKWRSYKTDNPLKKKSNPRLQIRNWCENSIKWQKTRQTSKSPPLENSKKNPDKYKLIHWG